MRPRGGRSSAATDPSYGNWKLGIWRCATAPVSLVGSSPAASWIHRRWGQRARIYSSSVPPDEPESWTRCCKSKPPASQPGAQLRPAEGCYHQALPAVVTPTSTSTAAVLNPGMASRGQYESHKASRQTKIIMTACLCLPSLPTCQPARQGPKNTAQVDGTTAEAGIFPTHRRTLQKGRRRRRGAPNGSLMEGREKTLQIVEASDGATKPALANCTTKFVTDADVV
jgi:hypothetical protein